MIPQDAITRLVRLAQAVFAVAPVEEEEEETPYWLLNESEQMERDFRRPKVILADSVRTHPLIVGDEIQPQNIGRYVDTLSSSNYSMHTPNLAIW